MITEQRALEILAQVAPHATGYNDMITRALNLAAAEALKRYADTVDDHSDFLDEVVGEYRGAAK